MSPRAGLHDKVIEEAPIHSDSGYINHVKSIDYKFDQNFFVVELGIIKISRLGKASIRRSGDGMHGAISSRCTIDSGHFGAHSMRHCIAGAWSTSMPGTKNPVSKSRTVIDGLVFPRFGLGLPKLASLCADYSCFENIL
jgi:hypothetical protein